MSPDSGEYDRLRSQVWVLVHRRGLTERAAWNVAFKQRRERMQRRAARVERDTSAADTSTSHLHERQ